LLHVAKWIRTIVLHPASRPPVPNPVFLTKLGLTLQHLHRHAESVSTRLRLINQQLEVEATSISLRFPAGERKISQTKLRQTA
jgi:hypothetical protein